MWSRGDCYDDTITFVVNDPLHLLRELSLLHLKLALEDFQILPDRKFRAVEQLFFDDGQVVTAGVVCLVFCPISLGCGRNRHRLELQKFLKRIVVAHDGGRPALLLYEYRQLLLLR